jgi:folate-binding protein YgfZ
MDDFNPTNMANTHETILFSGERCTEFINDIFKINTEKLSNNDFEIYVKDDRHSMIAMNDDRFEGCLFIFAAKDHDYWQSEILNDSLKSKYKLNAFDDIQYESKRIGYGIPAFGKEMTDVTNPLECGLNKYVSFTKGCYIGQEVIARLDTYDKISKHMVKIDSDNEIRAEGSKILTDGKECGYVTSASGNAGLGFVKTIFLDFDKKYQIKQNENLINCNLEQIKN